MRTIRPGELTHGVNPDDYPDYTVHGVYPWSVLRSDSREWQHRKKHWISRRVHEHDGRDDHLLIGAGSSERHRKISRGTSRFDPFLAELCYQWYSPPKARYWTRSRADRAEASSRPSSVATTAA